MSTITTPALSARAQSWLDAVGKGVGQQHVGWTSTVDAAAAHKARRLTKTMTATVLTGVEYGDLAVLEGREPGPLPWGEWLVRPHLIGHTAKDGVYREYARMYVIDGTIRGTYFVDGVRVSKADFDALLTKSAREAKAPVGGTITVKVENLTVL